MLDHLVFTPEMVLGPMGGLVISLFFCMQFLNKFDQSIERLYQIFQEELQSCNKRYHFILSELMKLKDAR